MELKEVRLSEIKDFAKMCSAIWHEYWPCILSGEQIDYMVEKFQSEKAIMHQIEKENYTYYFIVVNNEIAGYTGLAPKDGYLFLSKLYLRKEYRHRGLGKKVFDKIKTFGYSRIRLTVNKHNTSAYQAYLKYGFQTIESVKTDIGSGFVMDDYVMEYKMPEKL